MSFLEALVTLNFNVETETSHVSVKVAYFVFQRLPKVLWILNK